MTTSLLTLSTYIEWLVSEGRYSSNKNIDGAIEYRDFQYVRYGRCQAGKGKTPRLPCITRQSNMLPYYLNRLFEMSKGKKEQFLLLTCTKTIKLLRIKYHRLKMVRALQETVYPALC